MAYGRKTGGRKRGTPNRTTAAVREAILEAFEKAGGVDFLVGVAQSSPETFCRLLAKLLPTAVKADMDGPSLEELVAASWHVGEELDAAGGMEPSAMSRGGNASALVSPEVQGSVAEVLDTGSGG